MAISRETADPIGTVIDWLDACRRRRISSLLDLYDDAATLECACEGPASLTGREALEAYWRPKLTNPSPGSFSIDDVTAESEGVILDYQNHEGRPVRIHFSFNDAGKILAHPMQSIGSVRGLMHVGAIEALGLFCRRNEDAIGFRRECPNRE